MSEMIPIDSGFTVGAHMRLWDAGYEQGRPHFNEVRRQVQVYLEHPMEGW